MAGSSDDQLQCRKRPRAESLERAFRGEGNRDPDVNRISFRCFYCNLEIIPPCLHIIDNQDALSLREDDRTMKTFHKNCLSPHLQNYAETNAKRDAERRSVIMAGGNDSGNRGDNQSDNHSGASSEHR